MNVDPPRRTPNTPNPRDRIKARVRTIKKAVVVGSIAAFGAVMALVAGHTVGVTAHSAPSQTSTSSGNAQPGGGYGYGGGSYNNGGGSSSPPVGNGGSSPPVMGSGGS